MEKESRKNYLRGLRQPPSSKAQGSFKEYTQAFLEYLERPKTIFDIKDRSRLVLLLFAVIIILQMVVQMLADWYN